jgi:protein O-GlcNAc transferase
MNLDELLEAAVGHYARDELARAGELCEEALRLDPQEPEALHLLGVVRLQQGRGADALRLISQAIERDPAVGEFHMNLARALTAPGRGDEAIAALRQAIKLEPGLAGAHLLLAATLEQRGDIEQARPHFQKAVDLEPANPAARHRLGLSFAQAGRFPEAAAHLKEAISLAPKFATAHMHLGNVLKALGDLPGSVDHLRTAGSLAPQDAEVRFSLGAALQAMGQLVAAQDAYRAALALRPDYVEALNNLGLTFYLQRRYTEALPLHQKAVQLRPTHANAQCCLGMDSFALGMVDESIAAYREAVTLDPSDAATHAILALTMNYSASFSPEEVAQEHFAWGRRFQSLADAARPHENERDPDRRIRVGFLSADFIEHPVGFFIEPVLEHLDRNRFDVTCYMAGPWKDDLTDRARKLAGSFREVHELSDEALADQIRADRVDVLIELSGLTLGNRLAAVARRPAPVQATYLGFPTTTGVRGIDYRITDAWVDPPGMTEHLHTEKLVRLPKTFACYRAPANAPKVSELPAKRAGHVTFGSLNMVYKLTPAMIALWCRLLKAVPTSRLIMVVEDEARARFAEMFTAHGVDEKRVDVLGRKKHAEYLALFSSIDIALDSYPFNGHTTTCDCLWMGVPVVSLAGNCAGRRAGVSVMNNIGLPELVTEDEQQYVEIAAAMAEDLNRLERLRRELRPRMQTSSMMNGTEFAKDLGEAIRMMWRNWCAKHKAS